MSEQNFEIGDEVQHRTSGHRKMIFIGTDSAGDAICEWADKSGHPQRASFASSALKKYEPPRPGVLISRR